MRTPQSKDRPRPSNSWPSNSRPSNSNVTVVLGPTNTGKTHFAVERMLGHSSGIIGLPLRLLAREIYDRVVRAKGDKNVALITGEEKIMPPKPAYFVCTVEAMPKDHDAAFLAVDEIQLCADFERGHIFTERLLSARGREETMFMGAETMRPLLQKFLQGAEFVTRPRFSELSYTGVRKLTRLPPRSAIVAFSTAEVYGVAEMMRRHRGGAAVVMGALSPRTRNAQVALYQNGDVDFIVATDAIGMGLNLDIGHLSFASTRKFDGFMHRPLTAAEVSQIAGRAGRHLTNGSFGLTPDADDGGLDFSRTLIAAVENHHFPPVNVLQWRNAALNFSSPTDLIRSLEATPDTPGLTRGFEASDVRALKNISQRNDVGTLIRNPHYLRKLWECCQIPDFRKISPEDHATLAWHVFRHISAVGGVLPNEWMGRHLSLIDRVSGDIDSLAQRIAHVRTLTYIANRADWLNDPKHWQGLARDVEDRLSDALHERLSQRFIDRRTSVLMRALSRKDRLMANIAANGEIVIEDQFIGRLEGFRFVADEGVHANDDKAVRNAAEQALGQEISARARQFAEANDAQLSLKIADDLKEPGILWQGDLLARLKCGQNLLEPGFDIFSAPLLAGEDRKIVEERLQLWLTSTIHQQLKPLFHLKAALDIEEAISGLAKGIAFQVFENLGSLPRRKIAAQLRDVDKDGRRQLRQCGLWLGATSLYLPGILKPQAARLRAQLWALGQANDSPLMLPRPGLITIPIDAGVDANFYEMTGYRAMGDIAVRLDMLDRLFLAARAKAEHGPFLPDADMMSLVGCSGATFEKIMHHIGYGLVEVDAGTILAPEVKPANAATMAETPVPETPVPETPVIEKTGDDETETGIAENAVSSAAADTMTPEKPDQPGETETEATETQPTASPEIAAATARDATEEITLEVVPEIAPEVAPEPIDTESATPTAAALNPEATEEPTTPVMVKAFRRLNEIRPKRPERRPRPSSHQHQDTDATQTRPNVGLDAGEQRPERHNRPKREGDAPRRARYRPNPEAANPASADGAAANARPAFRPHAGPASGAANKSARRREKEGFTKPPFKKDQPARKEPIYDSTSPFAVLMDLKKSLSRK